MEKKKIIIPGSYRYLGNKTEGEVYKFQIQPGIYGKPTGCGFTTLAITDMTYSSIILMPRIELIKNKFMQH